MRNVHRYQVGDRWAWRIDAWVRTREGRTRLREGNIPTKEQAEMRLADARAKGYQGLAFDIRGPDRLTVQQAWDYYEPISKRDNASHPADKAHGAPLLRHLGCKVCMDLTQANVDGYRTIRLSEKTRFGRPPKPATMDHEIELLKRIINYAVRCGRLKYNPVAYVKSLDVPNTRETVLDDDAFDRAWANLPESLQALFLVLFDTGMRKGEVRNLRWSSVDLKTGIIRLEGRDTKSGKPRFVALQDRVRAALAALPRSIVEADAPYCFINPRSRHSPRIWGDINYHWREACAAAGLKNVWIHDLRRSFVTLARRRGIPESVVMQSSGHATRSVFARYNILDETDARYLARTMEEARATSQGAGQKAATGAPPKKPS